MGGRTRAIAGVLVAAAVAAGGWWWLRSPYRPVDRFLNASVLTANFRNFGPPDTPLGKWSAKPVPGDPVRTFHWREVADLKRGVLEVFAEAEQRKLDGSRKEKGRVAALDLIFASTHSAKLAVPKTPGGREVEIKVVRDLPSPARAGMLAVFTQLADDARRRFLHVRVRTVFLLNCGSVEDANDARTLDHAIRSLTGAPPERILSTSDKVNPDYRDICAGLAIDMPIVIFDSRPGGAAGETPRVVPVLRIGNGGSYHFGTGWGRDLAVPR